MPAYRYRALEGLSLMAREFDIRKPSGPYYYQNNPNIGEKQALTPLLFDTTTDWLIDQHLSGVSGIADYTLTSGYAFQISWFEVDMVSEEVGIASDGLGPHTRESTSGYLKSGLLYGTENDENRKLLCHEAYTVGIYLELSSPTVSLAFRIALAKTLLRYMQYRKIIGQHTP